MGRVRVEVVVWRDVFVVSMMRVGVVVETLVRVRYTVDEGRVCVFPVTPRA
jgi:hypothetical protein